VDKNHKAFSTIRMLTDNTLHSASSAATFPFVQSMTVLCNNTQYNPWLSSFQNLCSPQWFILANACISAYKKKNI